MNSKSLLALAVLLAVLAGAAVWTVKRAARATPQRLLWDGDAAKLSRLVLTRPDGRLAFARREGGWDVKEPLDYPAHGTALQQLLERLPKAVLTGPLSTSRERDSAFGLTPENAIRVQAEGDKSLDLWVGKAASGSEAVYVRLGSAAEVYEAGGLARYDVERSSMDWLSRTVLSIPHTALDKVVLKSSHTISLSRQGEGWTLDGKGISVSTAPGSPINVIQGALTNLEADQFTLAAPVGKPFLEVRILYSEKAGPKEEVLLVYPEKAGTIPVARKGETRLAYLLYPWKLDAFRTGPSEFR